MKPSKDELELIYNRAGSISGVANELKISYPTAYKWLSCTGINLKRRGFTAPKREFTGQSCRLAREQLGVTLDDMHIWSGISKTSLQRFETGKATIRKSTENKIRMFFKKHNIPLK